MFCSESAALWVTTLPPLLGAALTPTCGSLSDHFGRKKIWVLGYILNFLGNMHLFDCKGPYNDSAGPGRSIGLSHYTAARACHVWGWLRNGESHRNGDYLGRIPEQPAWVRLDHCYDAHALGCACTS